MPSAPPIRRSAPPAPSAAAPAAAPAVFAVRAQRKSTGDAARRGQKQPPTRSEVRPETKPETKCLCDVPQRPGRRRTLSFPAPLIVHDTDEGGCRTQRRFSDTRSSDTRSPEAGLEWAWSGRAGRRPHADSFRTIPRFAWTINSKTSSPLPKHWTTSWATPR